MSHSWLGQASSRERMSIVIRKSIIGTVPHEKEATVESCRHKKYGEAGAEW